MHIKFSKEEIMGVDGLEIRLYHFPDSVAKQKARIFLGLIQEYLAQFTNYDLDFNQIFIDNFSALIDAADAFPTHELLMDQLSEKTEVYKEKMAAARRLYQLMKPYIEKAFPGKTKTWNTFGYDNYDAARNNQKELPDFMKNLHYVATMYAAPLIAAGFTQLKIDEIQTSYNDLVKASDEQEKFKMDIQKATDDRIEAMNAMWRPVMLISRIGKLIFEDDYGIYQLFVLYESSTPGEPDIMHGNVPSGQTVVVMEEVAPSFVFTLKNPGTTILEYCLGETPEPCSGGIVLNPGEEHETIAADLGTGSILKVTNKSETVEGNYEVEVS